MSQYKQTDLYDFVTTTTEIECSKCGKDEATTCDEDTALDVFFNEGWRVTKSGNCYCPECAKKKLKL